MSFPSEVLSFSNSVKFSAIFFQYFFVLTSSPPPFLGAHLFCELTIFLLTLLISEFSFISASPFMMPSGRACQPDHWMCKFFLQLQPVCYSTCLLGAWFQLVCMSCPGFLKWFSSVASGSCLLFSSILYVSLRKFSMPILSCFIFPLVLFHLVVIVQFAFPYSCHTPKDPLYSSFWSRGVLVAYSVDVGR